MVRQIATLTPVTFQAVMDRLKVAFNLTTDKELAAALGINPNAFYNRRRLGSLPYEEIVAACYAKRLRMDWLLFGRGAPLATPNDRPGENVQPELLGVIVHELLRAFALQGVSVKDQPYIAIKIGIFAAQMYNESFTIENDDRRRAAIATSAESWASTEKAFATVAAGAAEPSSKRPSARPRASRRKR